MKPKVNQAVIEEPGLYPRSLEVYGVQLTQHSSSYYEGILPNALDFTVKRVNGQGFVLRIYDNRIKLDDDARLAVAKYSSLEISVRRAVEFRRGEPLLRDDD